MDGWKVATGIFGIGIAILVVIAIAVLRTPDFVRFERGERVSAELTRDQNDRCRVIILMEQRSYGARLQEGGCQ